MGDDETLEDFLHLFQFRQSVVGQFPVGDKLRPRGEGGEVDCTGVASGVGGDE